MNDIEENTGTPEIGREDVIVEWIVKNKGLTAKQLQEMFSQKYKSPGNNVHRYLKKLLKEPHSRIEKDKAGRYVWKGQSKFIQVPGAIDQYLLTQTEELVADILSSGLVKNKNPNAEWTEEERILFNRCQYLEEALSELQLRRNYSLRGWGVPGSNPEFYDANGNFIGGVSDEMNVEYSLKEELYHFLGVIDSLSRVVDKMEEPPPATRSRK